MTAPVQPTEPVGYFCWEEHNGAWKYMGAKHQHWFGAGVLPLYAHPPVQPTEPVDVQAISDALDYAHDCASHELSEAQSMYGQYPRDGLGRKITYAEDQLAEIKKAKAALAAPVQPTEPFSQPRSDDYAKGYQDALADVSRGPLPPLRDILGPEAYPNTNPPLQPTFCSQCGQDWGAPACGPTHAVIAAERNSPVQPTEPKP